MEIVEVKQNWPNDYFRIELSLGDICNYQCWYCWEDAHAAKYKWPNYELLVKNLSHLLDHYIKNTNKRKFEISLLGGECTHWKKFIPFVKHFKENYNCIFTLTTNGYKSLSWWERALPYLDQVTISHHQKFTDPVHLRDLADLCYKNKVLVDIAMLMDPTCWDECMASIEYYKKSKHTWSITLVEIIHRDINYTADQLKFISKVRARRTNLFFYLRVNKKFRSSVRVIDSNNKVHKISDNHLILNRLNQFKGWQCEVGVHWLSIKNSGSISGICGNGLYKDIETFNIFDVDFDTKFNPVVESTVCQQDRCWCSFEANMFKQRPIGLVNKKVIPIYAN
jgi:organic radical activating enzyme